MPAKDTSKKTNCDEQFYPGAFDFSCPLESDSKKELNKLQCYCTAISDALISYVSRAAETPRIVIEKNALTGKFTSSKKRTDHEAVCARLEPKPLKTIQRYIRAGFKIEEVDFTNDLIGIDEDDITLLLGISTRTLRRRKKAGRRLTPEESDRLFRLQKISSSALDLFEGNVTAMRRWLKTPLPVLSGETPLAYSDTEPGAQFVLNLITRLEHGVFA